MRMQNECGEKAMIKCTVIPDSLNSLTETFVQALLAVIAARNAHVRTFTIRPSRIRNEDGSALNCNRKMQNGGNTTVLELCSNNQTQASKIREGSVYENMKT